MASRSLASKGILVGCVCLVVAVTAWGAGPTRNVPPDEAQAKIFQAAAISLSKTVGTTSGICASTSSITVSAGTPVYYCYQIQNTGTVALNFHDLDDDQLGTILDNFNEAVAPGAFSSEVIVAETPMTTVTNTATWTAVTSLAGYTADDTITVDFEDISATGTVFTLGDDDVSPAFPIGFSFDFFSNAYTDAYVSSNGFVTFAAGSSSGCCTGQTLPDPAAPNHHIAGGWEDVDPGEPGAALYYETLGTAPNRRFIVQFSNVQHFPSGNAVTMEYKLFEGSNNIEVHYLDAPSDGGTHSAGIENVDGTAAVQYYIGGAGLTTPLAVRYALVPVETASDIASATVTVQAPNIDVSPLSLASVQLPDTTAQRTLTIANTGSLPLTWNLVEEPVAEAPGVIPIGTADQASEGIGPSDLKPGQSWGTPPMLSNWDAPEAILYDNGPLVTHPGGGAGGADASVLQTALGMGTYGFGYQVTAGNRLADDFTITGGGWFVETITFFGYQTGSSTTSTFTAMNLQIWDGPPDDPGSMVVFGDTTTNRLSTTTWSNAYRVLDTDITASNRPIMANTVTVNTFLGAGTYWLDFQADGTGASGPWAPPVTVLGQTGSGNAMQWTTAWDPATDVGPQDFPFIVEGTSDCANPVDVPWLSVAPDNGTTANGSSTPVTVTFDSTGMAFGTFNARLCLFSDDPDPGPGNGTNLVVIPADMTVSPTVPSISVVKTVGTTSGVCAATSNITVPAGSTVYYCYTVTNTGDSTFAMHDLDDDLLGSIFSGLGYVLAPGASYDSVTAGFNVSAVITAPTTNVGTWTAYTSVPGDGAQGQATATVDLTLENAIPTLDGTGVLILVLLLGGAGLVLLRRFV